MTPEQRLKIQALRAKNSTPIISPRKSQQIPRAIQEIKQRSLLSRLFETKPAKK